MNGSYVSKDPCDYGWAEAEEKFLPIWYEGETLPTVEELEAAEGINNEYVPLAETETSSESDNSSSCETDDDNQSDSDNSEDDDF